MRSSAKKVERPKTPERPNNGRRRKRAGFTLVELLLAMGLFLVGMTMVATIFPSALLQGKEANENSLSILMAENARAVITASATESQAVTVGIPSSAFDNTDCVDKFIGDVVAGVGLIDPNETLYLPGGAIQRGWIGMARQVGGGNEFEFVIIPYVNPPGETDAPGLIRTPLTYDVIDQTYVFPNPDDLAMGSPVIDGDTGQVAFVAGQPEGQADKAFLSRPWNAANIPNAWVVPGHNGTSGANSPAIGCFVFRTPLRP